MQQRYLPSILCFSAFQDPEAFTGPCVYIPCSFLVLSTSDFCSFFLMLLLLVSVSSRLSLFGLREAGSPNKTGKRPIAHGNNIKAKGQQRNYGEIFAKEAKKEKKLKMNLRFLGVQSLNRRVATLAESLCRRWPMAAERRDEKKKGSRGNKSKQRY